MSEQLQCKKCESPAEPGRTMCRAHLDLQKKYNENYTKKKAGLSDQEPPKRDSAPRAVVPAAPRKGPKLPHFPTVAVTRIIPAADLAAAVEQLREDLNVLERAQTILARMGQSC